MRVPPAQPCASRCSRSCARHGSGSRSACDDAGDAGVEDEAVDVGQLGAERARQAQVEEAVRRSSSGSRRAAARGAAARGGGPSRPGGTACRRSPRCAGSVPAGRAGGRGGARLAAQLQVLQAPGEAAHQRLDVQRMLALGQVAEVGRRQRFLAARAVRAAAPGSLVVHGRVRRRAGIARAGRRASAPGDSRTAPLGASLPQAVWSAAGTRHRTVRRSAAIRRRGRTAAPAGSSAARADRARRRAAAVCEHLDGVAAAARRSRWRAGSRGSRSGALQRPARVERRRGSDAQHAAADPGDDLAREGRRGRRAS